MSPLAERIESAMHDYWFHKDVRWSEWPRCAEYVAARLEGRVHAPRLLNGIRAGDTPPQK